MGSVQGVKDILIACIDGLKGFPEAINSIFPKTEIQLCIIHQIRNSLKDASKNPPPNPNSTLNPKLFTRQTLDLSEFARN